MFCAYRDVLGITINSFDYDEALSKGEAQGLSDLERVNWQEVDRPSFGVVSLYRIGQYHSHVGFVLDDRRMIHCERRVGTLVERLSTPVWIKRHVGYWQR